ncbi:CsiV family protein [Halopseudomonas salina]|uniref:Peptidoglycan-binding protein, CsiV n=1 Tax=Halopseudomonas salina TaxID=1323744 RepID=A0ABQ1PUG7_9GAMM|nr:CsiV family protein [Halopseudomonas salina]GGD04296.1 hypothetical protein GCM10007418_24210 [Halopseudomonas salina]
MNSVIRTLQLPALVAISVLASTVQAQDAGTYQVEAIVFAQPSAPISGNRAPDYNWANDAVMLEDTARSDVRKLDVTQLRMDREADKLAANGYRILMHQAWIQPADSNLKVAIHQGETLGEHYPVEAVLGLERAEESMALEVKAWRHTGTRSQDGQADSIVSEKLHQSRRLRLNEVHYLDHQSMGMLVRVNSR